RRALLKEPGLLSRRSFFRRSRSRHAGVLNKTHGLELSLVIRHDAFNRLTSLEVLVLGKRVAQSNTGNVFAVGTEFTNRGSNDSSLVGELVFSGQFTERTINDIGIRLHAGSRLLLDRSSFGGNVSLVDFCSFSIHFAYLTHG